MPDNYSISWDDTWNYLTSELEQYLANTEQTQLTPRLEVDQIKELIAIPDLEDGVGLKKGLQHILIGLKDFQLHTPHPRYFGLFNPRSNGPSIVADVVTAAFNPQLASWGHAPFANEVESFLIAELAKKFGYKRYDGVFATGGAEANQTAVLCALNVQFPGYGHKGLSQIGAKPLLYCSSESHHSLVKAARCSGLGSQAVRKIPVDDHFRMDPERLADQIKLDLQQGFDPFMVVATAGTTGCGSIDSLEVIGNIGRQFGLWVHVDAAYGGGLIISENHKHYLQGIEHSHSITFDVHKWLSVPMGCSTFITSHPGILSDTFRIQTDYMPRDVDNLEVVHPYMHSIQWSRRFLGLKLYLPLLSFGWKGYQNMIDHTIEMGDYFRERVATAGWQIRNQTPLPVICFNPSCSASATEMLCRKLIASGDAWISIYHLNGQPTMRTCITNYSTERNHIDQLMESLHKELLDL